MSLNYHDGINSIVDTVISRFQSGKNYARSNYNTTGMNFQIGIFPVPRIRKFSHFSVFEKLAYFNPSICIYNAEIDKEIQGKGLYRHMNARLEEFAARDGVMMIHFDTVNDRLAESYSRQGYEMMILKGKYMDHQDKKIFYKQFRWRKF